MSAPQTPRPEAAAVAASLHVGTPAQAPTVQWGFVKGNAEALVLMLVFAVIGGVAQYLRKVQARQALFTLSELIGEVVISASTGMLAGLLALDRGASIPMTLAAASVGGHMGTRLIFVLEQGLAQRLKTRLGEGGR